MKSSSEKLISDLLNLQTNICEFLNQYSKIKRRIYPGDMFISFEGDYGFEKLEGDVISYQANFIKDLIFLQK